MDQEPARYSTVVLVEVYLSRESGSVVSVRRMETPNTCRILSFPRRTHLLQSIPPKTGTDCRSANLMAKLGESTRGHDLTRGDYKIRGYVRDARAAR